MKLAINKTASLCLLFAGILISGLVFAQSEDSGESKVDTKVKELAGISIIGNKEAPKSLYIVPWKSSEVGVESDLVSSLMNDKLQPLDKDVFMRELEFYELSLSEE